MTLYILVKNIFFIFLIFLMLYVMVGVILDFINKTKNNKKSIIAREQFEKKLKELIDENKKQKKEEK